MDTIELDPRLRHAAGYLGRSARMLINGEMVGAVSGKTFEVVNPATGAVIANVPEADKADVDIAVAAARRAFDNGVWARVNPSEKSRFLWRIADLIERDLEELAELESIDNGKPYSIARVADLPLAVDMFRYMGGWATKLGGRTIPWSLPGQFLSYTVKEPVGVVGQIIPWNFPLLMAAWKIAPALAAGCTIVLKAAEQTPMTALRLAEIIQEAGVPAGVVNILTGFGETAGAALAAHPDVDKVAFTGSTEVGKLIVQAAAGNLKKVSLELGGKSPAIILPDADVEAAAAGAANAIFFNHGQCCCAGSRLFVHEKIYDKVVGGVADIASKIKVGPGLDPATEMGPLVSSEQFERVTGFIRSGREQGASVAVGGERVGNLGYFVAPTVFENTKPDMKIITEEIFGPVVCATRFNDDDLDRIAKEANDTSYGLAASIWSRDGGTAHKLAQRIRSGTVWINCHNVFDASLPFGGYKQSGWAARWARKCSTITPRSRRSRRPCSWRGSEQAEATPPARPRIDLSEGLIGGGIHGPSDCSCSARQCGFKFSGRQAPAADQR